MFTIYDIYFILIYKYLKRGDLYIITNKEVTELEK